MNAVDERERKTGSLAEYGRLVTRPVLENLVQEAQNALRSGCECADDMERILTGAMAQEILAHRRGVAA